MSLTILGLGTAVPDASFGKVEGLAVARALTDRAVVEKGANWLPNVYEQSGVETRYQSLGHGLISDLVAGTAESGCVFLPDPSSPRGPSTAVRMAAYAEHAPKLAVTAARRAMDEADIDPRSITQLVTVSCTGFVSPGVDYALIRELKLPLTVERTNVGFMGCHGAINGLRVANALAQKPGSRVLLAAVELSSINYYYGPEIDKVIANALFADGAAALVAEVPADTCLGPLPESWRVAATGSCIIPDSAWAMGWRILDNGFEMTLSRRIPGLIAENLKPWLVGWLAENDLTIAEVGSWAVHPGGPRILDAVEQGLDLPPEALEVSRGVLRDYGNMSSPTVLFILERLRAAKLPRPTVMIGFGPGLVAEAALWR